MTQPDWFPVLSDHAIDELMCFAAFDVLVKSSNNRVSISWVDVFFQERGIREPGLDRIAEQLLSLPAHKREPQGMGVGFPHDGFDVVNQLPELLLLPGDFKPFVS